MLINVCDLLIAQHNRIHIIAACGGGWVDDLS